MRRSKVDSKGRVVIPEDLRKELGLTEGSGVRLTKGEDDSIIIEPSVTPDEFIKRAEGFIKKGSSVETADPLKLKEIWTGS
jgi:AbrB family looped-hinge helix DNA binding protein